MNNIIYNGKLHAPDWTIEILNLIIKEDAWLFLNKCFLQFDNQIKAKDFTKVLNDEETDNNHSSFFYGDSGKFSTFSRTFKVENTKYKIRIHSNIFVQKHSVIVTYVTVKLHKFGKTETKDLKTMLNNCALRALEEEILNF